jgi:hypothetical protein
MSIARHNYLRRKVMFVSVSDPDPDPHGSALMLLFCIRVRIHEQGNVLKLTKKPDFQPFKMAFVPTQVQGTYVL